MSLEAVDAKCMADLMSALPPEARPQVGEMKGKYNFTKAMAGQESKIQVQCKA